MKHNRNRLFIVLLAAMVAVAALAGCGKTDEPPAATVPEITTTGPEAQEPASEPTEPPPPPPGPVRRVDTASFAKNGLSIQRLFVCDDDTTLYFLSPINPDDTLSESILVYSYSEALGGFRPASFLAGIVNLYPQAVMDDGTVTLVTLDSESYAFDSLIFLNPVTLEAEYAPLPADDFYDLHIAPNRAFAAISTYDYLRVTDLSYATEYCRIDRAPLFEVDTPTPLTAVHSQPGEAELLQNPEIPEATETTEDETTLPAEPPSEPEPDPDLPEDPEDSQAAPDEHIDEAVDDMFFADEMIPSATGWSSDSRYLAYKVIGWEDAYTPGLIDSLNWSATSVDELPGSMLLPIGDTLFFYAGCYNELPAGLFIPESGIQITLEPALLPKGEEINALAAAPQSYFCLLTRHPESGAGAAHVFIDGMTGKRLDRYESGETLLFEQAFFNASGTRLTLLVRQSGSHTRHVLTYDFLD